MQKNTFQSKKDLLIFYEKFATLAGIWGHDRKDKYDLGEFLWERAKEESPLLPPLKKK